MTHTLYAPIAARARSLCGVQWFWEDGLPGSDLNRVDYVRIGVKSAVFGVDQQTGQWIAPPRLDEVMVGLTGKTIILNISGSRAGWNTNGWANGYPDAPNALARFGNLCGWLASRYRPAWMEVWNEPNILEGGGYRDPQTGLLMDWFGALGQDTPDGGGARYAVMLSEVYRTSAAYTRILAGALAGVDQDELNPSYRFERGFIDAGGKFDGLSCHFYGRYNGTPEEEAAKLYRAVAFHQSLTAGRPVIVTETSFLRPDTYPDTEEFLEWQKQYAEIVRDEAVTSNVPLIWYAWKYQNWRGCHLAGKDAAKEWTR